MWASSSLYECPFPLQVRLVDGLKGKARARVPAHRRVPVVAYIGTFSNFIDFLTKASE